MNGHGTSPLFILGLLTYDTGDKFEGKWEDDKRTGNGKYSTLV